MKISTEFEFEYKKYESECIDDKKFLVLFGTSTGIYSVKNYLKCFGREYKQFMISIYEIAYNLDTKFSYFGGFKTGN